jgi:type IV pilus assembly protein PilX
MKSLPKPPFERVRIMKQRGVVLFFALIAMLAIMLAAVALVRSVDTSTIIAGNLAFKQAATTSGDAGTEAAIAYLATVEAANSGINVLMDMTHPFNKAHAGSVGDTYYSAAYYPIVDPNLSLTASSGTRILWDDTDSVLAGTDTSGNTTRYVIQRMCRNANVPIGAIAPNPSADCLFSGALVNNNGQSVPLPQEICKGDGCPVAGQAPQIRITSRTAGPKNTVSYVQAFVY